MRCNNGRCPLYCLDEADAALDEANQQAVALLLPRALLQGVGNANQIICISHHAAFHQQADAIIELSSKNGQSEVVQH